MTKTPPWNMDKKLHNIQNPQGFLEVIFDINNAIHNFMEMAKEKECSSSNNDLFAEEGKPCCVVARQFERPEEFRESFLDMIRVTFATKMFGTLLLNSNPAFMYQSIPEKPFTLGYVSAISQPGEAFQNFWIDTILPKIQEYGYALDKTTSLFISVAGSTERMSMDLLDEVCSTTHAGFSIDQVFDHIAADLKGQDARLKSEIYAGYVWDDGLENRLRVSLWLIIEDRKLMVV